MSVEPKAPIMNLFSSRGSPILSVAAPAPNVVAEPFVTCLSGRQPAKPPVPVPTMKEIEHRIDVRLGSLQEKVEAQLRTLRDQITSFSLELAPMQRALTHVKQQVIDAVGEMTVAVHRVEKNCASVSDAAAQAQHYNEVQANMQEAIADLDTLVRRTQNHVQEWDAQADMQQTLLSSVSQACEKIESDFGTELARVEATVADHYAKSVERANEMQESQNTLQRALLWDLENVAAGKVREKNDFAVGRVASLITTKTKSESWDPPTSPTTGRAAVVKLLDQDERKEEHDMESLDVKPTMLQATQTFDLVTSRAPPTRDRHRRDAGTGRRRRRSSRWHRQQKILNGFVRALTMEEHGNIAVAAEKANAYVLQESVWDASLLLGYPKLGLISNALLLLASS